MIFFQIVIHSFTGPSRNKNRVPRVLWNEIWTEQFSNCSRVDCSDLYVISFSDRWQMIRSFSSANIDRPSLTHPPFEALETLEMAPESRMELKIQLWNLEELKFFLVQSSAVFFVSISFPSLWLCGHSLPSYGVQITIIWFDRMVFGRTTDGVTFLLPTPFFKSIDY